MRIGLDARFYGPHAGTGIGRYTNRLVEHLERIDHANDYIVFLREGNFDFYHPTNPRFTKVCAPWRWYSIGEQIGFPRLLKQYNLDLTHYLHFNVPLAAPRPFLVTIHDLILSKFPTERATTLEPVFYWLKHTAYGFVIRSATHRAAAVIAVTEHTKKDIVQSFSVAPNKISVVYEACDKAQQLPLVDVHALEREFGITQPFLLYVGTAYPHKNLERLLEAVQTIRQRGERVMLVLVGREDYFYRRLRRLAEGRGMNGAKRNVVFTGYVNDSALDALYRVATAYVCPSLYEGFGLPGLEAMAHGLPVIAARTSSLPEVYGEAAEFFDPEDTGALASAMTKLLHDDRRRRELRELGLKRIRQFSWKRMAEQTLALYNVAGMGRKT